MALEKMTHEEYIKFCKKTANKYLFGIAICASVMTIGFVIMSDMKLPLISYVILVIVFGIGTMNLWTNFIDWRYRRCR